MKALIFRETGEPKSVLQLAEVPTPVLRKNSVRPLSQLEVVADQPSQIEIQK